jgi:hypothetical protein
MRQFCANRTNNSIKKQISAANLTSRFILPRIKICENRMNEAALKVERIGEVVSIMRLRWRRVLQDGSTSLREINCGSSCSAVLLRHLRQASVARRRRGAVETSVEKPIAMTASVARRRRGAELAGCGLGHFPQL